MNITHPYHLLRIVYLLFLSTLLAACNNTSGRTGQNSSIFDSFNNYEKPLSSRRNANEAALQPNRSNLVRGFFEPGSGTQKNLASSSNEASHFVADGKKYSVNFVNTSLQEFTRALFESVLKSNYTIDPKLKGTITIRTVSPVSKRHLLELTKQALSANGARLTSKGNTYQIIANKTNPNALPVRVLQLQYVHPRKLAKELQSLAPSTIKLIPSTSTSALIVTGPLRDIDAVASIVKLFDIDRMKGMSFALLPVRNAPVTAIMEEIGQVLGLRENPDTKIIAISRMNALLVISKKATKLHMARKWLKRLDQKNPSSIQSYVYFVQNRRAEELAKVLQSAFVSQQLPSTPNALVNLRATSIIPAIANESSPIQARSAPVPEDKIRITADPAANSLIIFTTPKQYKLIRAALYKLDVVPLQVLIEATIAEVTLTHALRHGVNWYLGSRGIGIDFSTADNGSVEPIYPGVNLIAGVPAGKLVLSALEGVTEVDIVSTPSMTVLDNQTAKLQVGDQVPIVTQTATSTQGSAAPIVNKVELKDTGVILSVTPRVNASGLVVLDIVQEASDVVSTTSSGIDSPTIRQRRFESSIAVKDGNSFVLGGLISRRNENGESGVPLIKDIPIFGNLFKTKKSKRKKTELIVIIRATVIRNQHDVQSIAAEFRQQMTGLSSISP